MEMKEMGLLLLVFISVIVGVILFQVIAQQNGSMLNTETLVNSSATAAANGDSFYLTDYRAVTVTSILNGTDGTAIPASNYTVTNNVVYNGALSTQVTVDDATFESETWFINGEAQPLTYVSDGATRAIVPLILIFFALAIALVALSPTLKSGIMEMMGK